MKCKHWIKRLVALSLSACLLMTDNILANGIGGAVGGTSVQNIITVSGGSSSANSSIVKTYPWQGYSSINRTGYRFYCIDNQENVVSSVFDLLLNSSNLGGGMNMYYSTYKENCASTSATGKDFEILTDDGPLGILRPNPRRQWEENGVTYRDNALYHSTAHMEPGGIISYVLDSSYATANEIQNNLLSAVYNGNTSDGSNSGKNTQGTTSKSDGTTVVVNTPDSAVNGLITEANNAINHGSASECRYVISKIMSKYGSSVFTDTSLYTTVSKLASIASGNIAAIKDVQNKFPSGVYQRAKKKEAYNYLVGKGYSSTDAVIAVFKAKATSTGNIGGGSLTLAQEDDLSQIIPTSSGENQSTDTHAIDELLSAYIKFNNTQAQAYIDSNKYEPTGVMSLYNYTLVVEPIIWFRWSNNTYQKASVGFSVDWEGTVTTAHKDEKWEWRKNGAPANASTKGASYVKVQDHVDEVVKITYKWKYQDDSGTVQTLETTQEIKEGTNYTYNNSNSWKSSTAIQPSNHKPDFTYDGNSVSWTKTAPSWSYASGSYNGYTDWYAVCDNSKYSEDSKWTYGSLRDAIHYCSNKGSVNSQLASLIQVYLPAAMVVTADKEFDGRTFNGMSELEFTFNGTDLNWLSSNSANYGYGIHMYQASSWFTKTRDDDKTTPGVQHQAPRPENPDGYIDDVGEITIVKTYREWSGDQIGKGDVKSEQTYIRYQEPSTVYILNEDTWTLSDWYVSKKSSLLKDNEGVDNTQGKWDDMKKDVYGSKSYSVETYGEYIKGDSSISGKPTEDGWVDNKTIPANDGGCMVSLEGGTNGEDKNTSTLYVLFERAAGDPDDPESNPDEGSGDEDLTQSEIYDVTSVDGIVDEKTFPGWPSTLLLGDTTFKTDDSTSRYMIARGEDKITLKEFTGNLSVLNNNEGKETSELMNNWYYGPEGGTAETRNYTAQYILGMLADDLITEVPTDLTVGVYHGKQNITAQYEIDDTSNSYSTRVNTGSLKLIPYYWMTVSDLDGNKSLRYVAGENRNRRTIDTYDYAEVTFEKQGSIQITSNMWATDRNLKADTLKGGATFKISTPTNAELKATTHSIVWDDYDDSTGSTNVAEIGLADSNEPLSSVAASTRHEEFVGQLATDIQDDFELTQYVAKGETESPAGTNSSTSAPNSSVKVTSGSNINQLGTGSSKASTESKYYLSQRGNINNTSLMETDVSQTQSKYTRVFSLPNGNIYYVTGNTYDECDKAMMSIMETARKNGGKYDSNIVCKKGAYGTVLVTGDIKNAIIKSGALQSLVNNIELNTGNDVNAPWCEGLSGNESKTWYNEGAWLTVLTQESTIEVGIISVTARALVVDPKLTPKQDKKSNSSSYNSSAFRVDWIGTGNGEKGRYSLGQFRGQTLYGSDGGGDTLGFKNLFGVSNTFYIPNRTVTDNR